MPRGSVVATVSVLVLLLGCGPSVQRMRPNNPLSGLSFQVAEFDVSEADIVSFDGSSAMFGIEVAQKIAEGLREAGVDAQVTPRESARLGKAIVRGKVTLVDGGSRALRYWIGFGAGATKFGVNGQVTDATGRVLGRFADERRSGFGMFGGDTETLLHRCVKSVGYDVANMITTGEYRQ
jgi:hypothetical protein